jgi:hypothetical protein
VYTDLVVLVHGYSGSAYDVRLLRSYLQLQLPRAAFLLSCANEQLVNEPIEKMAERLAQEVEGFIAGNGRRLRLERLSFVAFSIGALVLRAALRLPSLRRRRPCAPHARRTHSTRTPYMPDHVCIYASIRTCT